MTETEKVDAIIDAACGTFNISQRELRGPRLTPPKLIRARVLASNALREMTELSFPEIGRLLNRDHSTVFYHVKKCRMPWIEMAIKRIRKEKMKEPPTWRLLRDLGEVLGFIPAFSENGTSIRKAS